MIKIKIYLRKCLNCKDKFEPRNANMIVCSASCATLYAIKQRSKERKEKNKVIAEKLKTHREHLRELQVVFNKYIRLRDEKMPCVSCGTAKTDIQYHAGHYKSCGAYPNLRFNELNCWKQCSACNNHLHGNIIEYRKELIKRIGVEKVEEIESKGSEVLKLSIPELMELKTLYKNKIKSSKMLGEKDGKL
jgi:hypothetical protein